MQIGDTELQNNSTQNLYVSTTGMKNSFRKKFEQFFATFAQ